MVRYENWISGEERDEDLEWPRMGDRHLHQKENLIIVIVHVRAKKTGFCPYHLGLTCRACQASFHFWFGSICLSLSKHRYCACSNPRLVKVRFSWRTVKFGRSESYMLTSRSMTSPCHSARMTLLAVRKGLPSVLGTYTCMFWICAFLALRDILYRIAIRLKY